MDESGDAPEHLAVRWYQGLPAVERFSIQLAASLFGGGAFFAAVGFGLTSGAPPVSALLDRLGWSLMQLAGAIVVVQVVLHRRTASEKLLSSEKYKKRIYDKYRSKSKINTIDALSKQWFTYKHDPGRRRYHRSDFDDLCQTEILSCLDDPSVQKLVDDLNDLLQLEHSIISCHSLYKSCLRGKDDHSTKIKRNALNSMVDDADNILSRTTSIFRDEVYSNKVTRHRLEVALHIVRIKAEEILASHSADTDAP